MSESPYIIDLTLENFEQVVLRDSQQTPVLIDFWASWCQPCQILMPLLSKLADEYQGKFILAKLNTEEQQEIAAQFGIRSIPTVKLFKDGAQVDEFAGALPEADIRTFLDKHIPRETNSVLPQAEQMMAMGQFAEALELLAPAQAADPNNYLILIAMAKAHAALGNFDAAKFAIDALPEDQQNSPEISKIRGQLHFAELTPDPASITAAETALEKDANDHQSRYTLALRDITQGQIESAIQQLLGIMMRELNWNDDAARKTLIQLLEMLGDDPIVNQARRQMFNLMH